jgi:hypothetical protein
MSKRSASLFRPGALERRVRYQLRNLVNGNLGALYRSSALRDGLCHSMYVSVHAVKDHLDTH